MQEVFFAQMERTERLIGRAGLEKLHAARVAIVGLGGVGSYALEALVRGGIGHFILVDHDQVERSNLNRQLLALHSTLGDLKVDVAEERARSIYPQVEILKWPTFCTADNCRQILTGPVDFIVDAIDVVPSKVGLIQAAWEQGIPIASSMGFAHKLDPTAIRIADIEETQVCPLARKMRRELRKIGIETGVQVVFSLETPRVGGDESRLGSISYVPATAGLFLASMVIQHLLQV